MGKLKNWWENRPYWQKLINKWSISGAIIGFILGIIILIRQDAVFYLYPPWFNAFIENLKINYIINLIYLFPIIISLIFGIFIFLLYLIFKKINFLKELKQSKKLMIITFIVVFLIYIASELIFPFSCRSITCGGEACILDVVSFTYQYPILCSLTTLPSIILTYPTLFPFIMVLLFFPIDFPITHNSQFLDYFGHYFMFFMSALIWSFYIIFIKCLIKYLKRKQKNEN